MRRKLLSAAVSASAGIAVTYCFGILTGLLTCGAFLFVFGCQFRENRLYVWLAAAFFCGCLLLSFSGNKAASGLLAACPPEQDTVLTGRVTEIQCLEEDKYKICCEIGGEKLLCSYYQKLDRWWNLIGADIRFSTRIETPEPAGNPRTFDYSLYLKSRGIHYTAVIGNFDIESQNCSLLMRMQRKILERREQFLQELQISEQAAALLRGALFGDTAQLNEDTYEEFRQNGTAHVLAVSGLHVGMLYGVYRILSKKRKGILLPLMFMALLLVYGTAALWAVSVTRAVILIFLLLAADLLERRYDLLTGLAAIAVLSMARNPYVIFGAGFQMSFLAVLSMAFLIPALKKKMNETLAAMISVQLGLMPYMAYTFNYVSLVGFICNVPVIFLISILVPAGIGGYLFCLFTGAVPPVLPELLNGMSVLVLNVNHFFTSDGILSFDVVSPPLWLICIIYFLMFFCSSEYFLIYFGRRQWKNSLCPWL